MLLDAKASQTFTVELDIPPFELERLYRGEASVVVARAVDGRRVQFPARSLRPFVTLSGVRGTFVISTDASHRLLGVVRAQDERG